MVTWDNPNTGGNICSCTFSIVCPNSCPKLARNTNLGIHVDISVLVSPIGTGCLPQDSPHTSC